MQEDQGRRCCVGTGQRESWNWYGTRARKPLWRRSMYASSPRYPRQRGIGKERVKLSQELLGDGEVQSLAHLVANLASEIVIQTDNLPMANVPGSDQVSRTAHRQRQDRQRQSGTRPSTEHAGGDLVAFLCPVLRAEAAMAKLKNWPRPTGAMPSRTRAQHLLSSVRTEIEMAQIPVGYGKKADFKTHFRSGEVH